MLLSFLFGEQKKDVKIEKKRLEALETLLKERVLIVEADAVSTYDERGRLDTSWGRHCSQTSGSTPASYGAALGGLTLHQALDMLEEAADSDERFRWLRLDARKLAIPSNIGCRAFTLASGEGALFRTREEVRVKELERVSILKGMPARPGGIPYDSGAAEKLAACDALDRWCDEACAWLVTADNDAVVIIALVEPSDWQRLLWSSDKGSSGNPDTRLQQYAAAKLAVHIAVQCAHAQTVEEYLEISRRLSKVTAKAGLRPMRGDKRLGRLYDRERLKNLVLEWAEGEVALEQNPERKGSLLASLPWDFQDWWSTIDPVLVEELNWSWREAHWPQLKDLVRRHLGEEWCRRALG